MSSFVISKSELVKAAGYISGVAESKNYYRESALRLWNFKSHRVYNADDFYQEFVRIYNLNALSVMEQYNDKAPETDEADYMAEFKQYKNKALKDYMDYTLNNNKNLEKNFYQLVNFFSSVSYQVENERYNFLIMNFLNQITERFTEIIAQHNFKSEDIESWGSLNF